MSYFAVIQTGQAVFGVGTTKEEAITEAKEWADSVKLVEEHEAVDGDMILVECSETLCNEVNENGGDVVYEEIDGVYCLESEAA